LKLADTSSSTSGPHCEKKKDIFRDVKGHSITISKDSSINEELLSIFRRLVGAAMWNSRNIAN
jgi:hypothetical protein